MKRIYGSCEFCWVAPFVEQVSALSLAPTWVNWRSPVDPDQIAIKRSDTGQKGNRAAKSPESGHRSAA